MLTGFSARSQPAGELLYEFYVAMLSFVFEHESSYIIAFDFISVLGYIFVLPDTKLTGYVEIVY